MYKILFAIIALVLSATGAFASGDITSSGFTIDLSQMDPVGGSHSDSPGAYAGKGALLVVIQKISELLLFMIPIIAIVATLIAGYYYIFSAGDSEKAGQAKSIIKWNLIAIVVAFMSWSIIQLIASLFS